MKNENEQLKRPVCVHFHIFKNAGTTMDTILEKNFFKNAVSLDTSTHKGRLTFEDITNYINKKGSGVKSFSSHQIRFPVPKSIEFNFLPIIFIRNPIDRAFSVYSFNRKRSDVGDDLTVIKAKELSLKDYIDWLIRQEKNMVIKNHQVLFMSGKPRGSPVYLEDLEIAKSRLKECILPGVVDRMDESLVLGEENLKKFFDNIDFSYTNQNVSRKGSLIEKLAKGKEELGEEIYSNLENANKYDLELYEFANQNLDGQLRTIKNYAEKIEAFRERCKRLNN